MNLGEFFYFISLLFKNDLNCNKYKYFSVLIFKNSDYSVTFGFLGVVFYERDGLAQVIDICFSDCCHIELFCNGFVIVRYIAKHPVCPFKNKHGSDFRTINLYYTSSKLFSGFLLLSDIVNSFNFDHNSYSRKISLSCSSDITLFKKSTTYFKGLEKCDCVPLH